MNTLVKAVGLAAALAFLSPAGALAAGDSVKSMGTTHDTGKSTGMMKKSFDELDKNHDGKLSASELKAAGGSVDMSKADTNKDGKLDRSEFSAFETSQSAPGATQPGAIDKTPESSGAGSSTPSGKGGAY